MISDIHNVMQTELDGKPSRSVRIIVNVLNACCTAANAFRDVYYQYNIPEYSKRYTYVTFLPVCWQSSQPYACLNMQFIDFSLLCKAIVEAKDDPDPFNMFTSYTDDTTHLAISQSYRYSLL